MDTRQAVAMRILELCRERCWTPNHFANVSAVPQSTIKSILNGESANPSTVTIKKLCDGFGIHLAEFFSTDYFDSLEQEKNNQSTYIFGNYSPNKVAVEKHGDFHLRVFMKS